MRKAFLCHSSVDKDYVRVVAKRLGRALAVLDELSFDPGEDFRQSIEKGLDEAVLFVFFASKNSLASLWCKYELDEANYRKIMNQMEKHLVLIIDPTVNFGDLPKWLKRAKAQIQPNPNQAFRDIQHSLLSLLPQTYRRPFIGRQSLIDTFSRSIAVNTTESPRILIVSGLEGIGRRSYLERVTSDNLNLNLGPFVFIDAAHDLSDIYFWALDETAEMHTRSQMADEIESFNKLSTEEQVEEIIRRLNILCKANCIPCIIDEGGLLDESGKYKKDYDLLLRQFSAQDINNYLALIHRRAPFIRDSVYGPRILAQKLQPLEKHEIKLLITQILRQHGTAYADDMLDLIIENLDGYPPSTYFAAQFAREYGFAALAVDKSTLQDFKVRRFTKYINDLKLTTKEWKVLQYLSSERLLPLEAIAIALSESPDEVVKALYNLIDHSLVMVADEKYAVSSPIRDAIIKVRGHIDKKTYEQVRINLTKIFWASKESSPSLEVIDATLHAVARAGSTDFAPYRDMVRVSTVHRLAQECYYRQEWSLALEYAIRAENMSRTPRMDAARIHFKSLVQMENWQKAKDKLSEIKNNGDPLALYLEGFMLKKMHRYEQACKVFQSAVDAGDNGFAIHRDYADCLHRCGKYAEAKEQIEWILKRDSDNVFVLDMMVRICIDGDFLEDAEKILGDLERSDVEKRFVYHRKARLLHKKKFFENALVQAELACNTDIAPFEAYAEKCDLLICLERFPDAWSALNEMDRRFGSKHRSDVQIGLRTKLLIRQGRWREAKSAWDRLENKMEGVHQVLLAQIFDLQANDKSQSLVERTNASKEAANIRSSVKNKEYEYPEPDEELTSIPN